MRGPLPYYVQTFNCSKFNTYFLIVSVIAKKICLNINKLLINTVELLQNKNYC